MKVYMESGDGVPLILNLGTGWNEWLTSCPGCFMSKKGHPYPHNSASGHVWMFWRQEKSLVPTRIQSPDHPDCSVVNIITVLLQLPYCAPACWINICLCYHYVVQKNAPYHHIWALYVIYMSVSTIFIPEYVWQVPAPFIIPECNELPELLKTHSTFQPKLSEPS